MCETVAVLALRPIWRAGSPTFDPCEQDFIDCPQTYSPQAARYIRYSLEGECTLFLSLCVSCVFSRNLARAWVRTSAPSEQLIPVCSRTTGHYRFSNRHHRRDVMKARSFICPLTGIGRWREANGWRLQLTRRATQSCVERWWARAARDKSTPSRW